MNRGAILLPVVAGALGLAVAGCGGGTRTVSVSSGAPTTSSGPAATAPATTPSAGKTGGAGARPSAGGGTAQTGGTSASSSSGSSSSGGSEPAFVGQGAGTHGLTGAVAVLHSHGFSALDTGQYRPDQTLRVLVGARQGSADAHAQQAFFFVDGNYLGTDTKDPSAQIRVVGQNDTEVTLAYALYGPHDPLCCPSGGQAQVRYQLDNGRLSPLDPIPTASASATSSRQ